MVGCPVRSKPKTSHLSFILFILYYLHGAKRATGMGLSHMFFSIRFVHRWHTICISIYVFAMCVCSVPNMYNQKKKTVTKPSCTYPFRSVHVSCVRARSCECSWLVIHILIGTPCVHIVKDGGSHFFKMASNTQKKKVDTFREA